MSPDGGRRAALISAAAMPGLAPAQPRGLPLAPGAASPLPLAPGAAPPLPLPHVTRPRPGPARVATQPTTPSPAPERRQS